MGQVVDIPGKTDQRIERLVSALKSARTPLTYDALIQATGATYDLVLYVTATLIHVGMVRRVTEPDGPGRPKVRFQWVPSAEQTRASGARSSRQGGSRLSSAA